MMTTSSHTPPLLAEKVTALYHLSKLWLKPVRCASLSRFRRKNLLPTLRLEIAAEVYSNARLLCSQNPLLPSFSFSFLREKNVAPYLQYLYLSRVYLAWGRWGSFMCGGRDAIHLTKIQTGPTEKRGPPQKVDQFFRNFSWVGPNRSIELWTEISGNFRVRSIGKSGFRT